MVSAAMRRRAATWKRPDDARRTGRCKDYFRHAHHRAHMMLCATHLFAQQVAVPRLFARLSHRVFSSRCSKQPHTRTSPLSPSPIVRVVNSKAHTRILVKLRRRHPTPLPLRIEVVFKRIAPIFGLSAILSCRWCVLPRLSLREGISTRPTRHGCC